MKKLLFLSIAFASLTATAQDIRLGINSNDRARLEVNGVAGNGNTAAIFGTESTGISFQRNWPTIGFNQYRDAVGSRYIGNGYAAIQHLDPGTGIFSIDMIGHGAANAITQPTKRAVSIGSTGFISFGGAPFSASITASRIPGLNATAHFLGTTHHTAFNSGNEEHTYIRAGKDGGTVFLNDITGGKVCMVGAVGINTANPQHPLEVWQKDDRGMVIVNGTSFNYWEWGVSPANGNLDLAYNGVYKGSFNRVTGSYSSTSDARLKNAVEPLPSVLDKVMQLRPVEYEMIANISHQKTIGFLAQEVKEVFPELVNIQPDAVYANKAMPDLHTLTYDGFGVLAVKTIQEQQQIMAKQREEITAIRTKLDELKKLAAGLQLK